MNQEDRQGSKQDFKQDFKQGQPKQGQPKQGQPRENTQAQTDLLAGFQPLMAIAPTPAAYRTLEPLWRLGYATLLLPERADWLSPLGLDPGNVQFYAGSLRSAIADYWDTQSAFVFGLAVGATLRLIAPLLKDKATDPAILAMDNAGKFVISLSGGHQGGADRLTHAIAQLLAATPILTGSANQLGIPGIDVLGVPFGWTKGHGDWTGVSAAIARQDPVEVFQEAGSTLWQSHLPAHHSFQFGCPGVLSGEFSDKRAGEAVAPTSARARIWISPMQRQFTANPDFPKVQWHPRVLWVGIGCERGTARSVIEMAIQSVCTAHHLAEAAIAGIATLDLKADEVGILELCRDRQWQLRCFPAATLRKIPVPHPSIVVEREVGTPSVAEAAAIAACQVRSAAARDTPEEEQTNVVKHLRVTKQVLRAEGEPGAVTIAIAQAEREYIGRTGALWLIGIGPGQIDQMTTAARTAIVQADVVIGYSLYIDLIRSLVRPGQIVEELPITQERQRAERAIELAQWGLTVAVVSSGDCGIYGMAGLVMEQLQTQNWDGKIPRVQVFPGITALQAAAARLGAPLMHDFCAISLSDLLTPWEVIEKRLTAAATADFVTALYNPKSQTRTQQIAIAQAIFLRHRSPETPVAIVRSAYRADEQITVTTLANMLEAPIDMLTVVLIGNRSTRTLAEWMITPRGYLGFGSSV